MKEVLLKLTQKKFTSVQHLTNVVYLGSSSTAYDLLGGGVVGVKEL